MSRDAGNTSDAEQVQERADHDTGADACWPEPSPLSDWWEQVMGPEAVIANKEFTI